MKQIIMNLNSADNYLYYTNEIRQGENFANELVIKLSPEWTGYKYLIRFKLNNNNEVVTPELFATNGEIKYGINTVLTNEAGNLKVQFEAFETVESTTRVIKSAITNLRVTESLEGGTTIIPEDYVPWYTQAVNAASTATTKAEEAAASAAVAQTVVNTHNADSTSHADIRTLINNLKAYTEFPITNLVINGDISQGTTGWSAIYGTISASNNICSLTSNGTTYYSRLELPKLLLAVNQKRYLKIKARVTNANCNRLQFACYGGYLTKNIDNPMQNQWYDFSGIVVGNADTAANSYNRLQLVQYYADAATSNGKVMEVQYALEIDLPATFGAGNEPTQTEMDELLTYFPNSWFNGTVDLANYKWLMTYLLKKIREKASIVQEAWITPTLLNGWVNFNDATYATAQYFKDAFGIVHLKGMVKSGTLNISMFALPVGYRPAKFMYFSTASNNAFGMIIIDSNGNVSASGNNTWVSLNGITFTAGV